MRRWQFALPVVLLALLLPQAASAKESVYSFRVVTPSGKVGLVRGAAAKTWWQDYGAQAKRGCSCMSPDAAAHFAGSLFSRYITHLQDWPVAFSAWLIVSPNRGSLLYYPPDPSTWGTPVGIVLAPATHGGNRLRWDDWQLASVRMQKILQLALRNGTITTYQDSSVFPTGWAVGGGAVLLAFLVLGFRRSPDLRGRLRQFRFRLAP